MPNSPAEIAAALRGIGVRPARDRGQSFLTDPFVADAEVALLGTDLDAPVTEIGGGLGILTAALVRRRKGPITVVERDPQLAAHLRRTFGSRIQVLEGDAQVVGIDPAHAVIGNLPFSVATPILLRLFELRVPRVVAMVQREVADRLAAIPGGRQYGRLSIIAALYGSVEPYQIVPRSRFFPVPQVDARLVVFTAREGALPVPHVVRFERIVRVLFSSRRKQLVNLLPRLGGDRADAARWAKEAGWPESWPQLRPEALPPEAFFRLARVPGLPELRPEEPVD